jgi:Ca2+-binding RTX toxin-like protein
VSRQCRIATTRRRFVFAAKEGRDWIDGGLGDDLLEGGIDDDFITGRAGDDRTIGHGVIDGGAGNDYLVGEAGRDHLVGGPGSNALDGGTVDASGTNTLDGTLGYDCVPVYAPEYDFPIDIEQYGGCRPMPRRGIDAGSPHDFTGAA